MEASALFMVVAFPLFAIGWYFFGSDSSHNANSDSYQNSTIDATIAAPSNVQQASVQATPASGSATITVNNESSIPRTVAVGQIVPFSFTIKNTGANASFLYKVSVRWSNGEVNVIDENNLALAAGDSTVLSEGLKFETANAKGIITIQLLPSGPVANFAMPRS